MHQTEQYEYESIRTEEAGDPSKYQMRSPFSPVSWPNTGAPTGIVPNSPGTVMLGPDGVANVLLVPDCWTAGLEYEKQKE